MFGRKKRFSTSRFVERAIELDTFQLFTSRCLTVAISKISTGSTLSHSDQRYASAIGVLHDERGDGQPLLPVKVERSEEHTSELQSLMRISYAVLRLKK